MSHNGLTGFIVLSEVLLCATGGEALYADMGHLGRKPIINASLLVIPALIINYLGQGAFMFDHPKAKYVLFEMFYDHSCLLYVPFLILSILATAIASQAMISGVFSIVYQAINTGMLPTLNVDYTSRHTPVPDLRGIYQLDTAVGRFAGDGFLPEVGQDSRGLRSGRHRDHDHHRAHDDLDFPPEGQTHAYAHRICYYFDQRCVSAVQY